MTIHFEELAERILPGWLRYAGGCAAPARGSAVGPAVRRRRQVPSGVRRQHREGQPDVNPKQVAAPFKGVVTITVASGEKVKAGDTIATIEAMKLEAATTALLDGTVERLVAAGTRKSREAIRLWCSTPRRQPR